MKPIAVFLAAAAALFASSASALTDGQIETELNKLEQVDSSCRVYMVFRNGGEEAVKRAGMILFLFDQDGVIHKRLRFEAGPLAPAKTLVKLFDATETDCLQISRILLNDVADCELDSGLRDDCVTLFTVSSKAEAALES